MAVRCAAQSSASASAEHAIIRPITIDRAQHRQRRRRRRIALRTSRAVVQSCVRCNCGWSVTTCGAVWRIGSVAQWRTVGFCGAAFLRSAVGNRVRGFVWFGGFGCGVVGCCYGVLVGMDTPYNTLHRYYIRNFETSWKAVSHLTLKTS